MKIKRELFTKKRIIWGAIILLVIILIAFFVFKKDKINYITESVSIGDVVQTVSVTGQIKPERSASLRFRISGIINSLYNEIGDHVIKNELLARLDTQDLERRLIQARADLASAEVAVANAWQLVNDTQTENTQSTFSFYSDAPKVLADILNSAQQAHTGFASFYDTDEEVLDVIENSTRSESMSETTNDAKPIGDLALNALENLLASFPATATNAEIDKVIIDIQTPIQSLNSALSALTINIFDLETNALINSTNLEAYKATASTARTNLNAAIANQVSLKNGLATTSINNQLSANSAQSQYRLKVAGRDSAQATVSIAQRNLNDAYLRAPIAGIVSAKNMEIGELVTTSNVVYRIIDGDELEVVADIPEVDIGQVLVGNQASGTLDALEADEIFTLRVVSIEPDQTMIDGVVHYKTHLLFGEDDVRFKSGMSVNLDIVVKEATSTLLIPRRALKQKNGETYVQIYISDTKEPRKQIVEIGIKGDRNVQITKGLKEGQLVITGQNDD